MKVLGLNFRKINVERLADSMADLKIKTNMDILDISPTKASFIETKEEFIIVKFTYSINYEPEYAKVELNGNILLSDESKAIQEILKNWKDKKLTEDFRIFVLNLILKKSTLKALELEEELNLPLHMPMPSLRKENKQSKDK